MYTSGCLEEKDEEVSKDLKYLSTSQAALEHARSSSDRHQYRELLLKYLDMSQAAQEDARCLSHLSIFGDHGFTCLRSVQRGRPDMGMEARR